MVGYGQGRGGNVEEMGCWQDESMRAGKRILAIIKQTCKLLDQQSVSSRGTNLKIVHQLDEAWGEGRLRFSVKENDQFVAHFLCAKLAVECLERKQDAEFPVRPATSLPQSRGRGYQAG